MITPTKDLLAINLNKLEEECQGQPALAFIWGMELVKARKVVKTAKNKLKVLGAEIAKRVREDPAAFAIPRATDEAVKEIILLDPQSQEETKDLIQLEYEEELLEQFVYALRDRKDELSNCCSLHGQMYWSKPNASKPMTEQSRVAAMQATAEVTDSVGKKAKKALKGL